MDLFGFKRAALERQRDRDMLLGAMHTLAEQNIAAIEAATRQSVEASKAIAEQAGVLKKWIDAFTANAAAASATVREPDPFQRTLEQDMLKAGMPAEYIGSPEAMLSWVLRNSEET